MSKHAKTHGVRHAWARRCREVNDHPDEDRMVNTPVAYQKIQQQESTTLAYKMHPNMEVDASTYHTSPEDHVSGVVFIEVQACPCHRPTAEVEDCTVRWRHQK